MRIVPQKTNPGAGYCQTNDGQLFDAINVRQMEILTQYNIAGNIGKNGIGQFYGYRTTDGQTIHAIRQICTA